MSASCYLCGALPADTRDHIPPRGLFPEPRPSNLITVPCCRRCNAEFSPEDDYFRLVFASSVERSAAGDHIWDSKVITNTVRRLPREVDLMLASCEDRTVLIDGRAQDVVAFEVDRLRLERYAIRLVKGLIRHHYPDFDYAKSSFDVRLATLREQSIELLVSLQAILDCEVLGSEVFRYRFGLTDSGHSGVWVMTFYSGVSIAVFHSANRYGET
jgi:hypothetical protein